MVKIIYCWNCCNGIQLCNGYVRCHKLFYETLEGGDGFCSHAESRSCQVSIENIRKRINKYIK